MARWSDVAQPDDPLRDDNHAVVRDEDVLRDSVAGGVRGDAAFDGASSRDAASYDAAPDDLVLDSAVPDGAGAVRGEATPVLDLDERPTSVLPRVTTPPAPQQRSWTAGLAPWAVFAAVAVVVITATSTWAASLQGPAAYRQTDTPRLDPVPTLASPAPPTPEAVETPAAEPEPEPEPEPVARSTQRQRPTRAPAPPPPAEEPPPPPSGAVADAEAPDTPEVSAQEGAQPDGADPNATGSGDAAVQSGEAGDEATDSDDDDKDKKSSDSDDKNKDDD